MSSGLLRSLFFSPGIKLALKSVFISPGLKTIALNICKSYFLFSKFQRGFQGLILKYYMQPQNGFIFVYIIIAYENSIGLI